MAMWVLEQMNSKIDRRRAGIIRKVLSAQVTREKEAKSREYKGLCSEKKMAKLS